MVRVAHLLSGLAIGGKERVALRLAKKGRREGHDHAVVLFDQSFRSPETDFDPGEVPVHFLPRRGGLDLRFAWRLARLLGRLRTDVVHAHNDTALFYAALASQFLLRRPRVVGTFHTWPSHPTSRARWLNRLASRVATVTAVSAELSERLVAAEWLARCPTIWNGVDAGEFFPGPASPTWRRGLSIRDDAILVGHVARLDPIKRHSDLLKAADLLADTAPQVVLLLVGQGPLAEQVGRDAAGLRNLRFLPRATDMGGLMRGLDILTLCSAHEAAPLVLLEAMACGVPVVATHVGGIPYMVGTGDQAGGLLVPPLDPAALAGAIRHLASSPEERARRGAAALRRVTGFSFETEWSAYDRLYRGTA